MKEPETMREILLALSLCSVTPAAKMDADSGGGSARHYEDSPLADPFGKHHDPEEFPHLHYARLYAGARDNAGREEVRQWALKALQEIRHSRADRSKEETWEQLRARIGAFAGWPAGEVALETRTGVRTVHKARRELGVDQDLGQPPAGQDLRGDITRRRQAVRARAEAGMSVRNIAFSLGVSVGTVHADLGRG